MNDSKSLRIIISGGGTGGHLFPAIAIGDLIKKKFPNAVIHYIGSKYGIESTILAKRNLEYTLLSIRGFARSFKPTSIIRNLGNLFQIALSYFQARRMITKIQPHIVVGTGGYASGLPLLAAVHKKIPTLIHEQNSYPGITTRWLISRVTTVCTAYPLLEKYCKKKALSSPETLYGRIY